MLTKRQIWRASIAALNFLRTLIAILDFYKNNDK
jgi:hypothetical protein